MTTRKDALKLFLFDPEIPLHTNEIENALRVMPLGRKNGLFCWTEVVKKSAPKQTSPPIADNINFISSSLL